MALPLIAAGLALGAAILHESNKKHYKNLEIDRNNRDGEQDYKPDLVKSPSDIYNRGFSVKPLAGSIVCCEVYNFLDHTGIWIDEFTIIELSNSGLIKSVSADRFLQERSGQNIFVACDNNHQPIVIPGAQKRALENVYSYREYDVIENNCHRFVNYCLTGFNDELSRFTTLNKQIAKLSGKHVYWDKVQKTT